MINMSIQNRIKNQKNMFRLNIIINTLYRINLRVKLNGYRLFS